MTALYELPNVNGTFLRTGVPTKLLQPEKMGAAFGLACIKEKVPTGNQEYLINLLYAKRPCVDTSRRLRTADLNCCKKLLKMMKEEQSLLEDYWLFLRPQPSQFEGREYYSEKTVSSLGSYGRMESADMRSLHPFIQNCSLVLNDKNVDCTDMFKISTSMAGIVYTMNQNPLKNILSEDVNDLWTKKVFRNFDNEPEENIFKGKFFLKVVIMPRGFSNFRLVFHDRNNMPDFMGNPLRMKKMTKVFIKLHVEGTTTDESLRSLPMEKRKCAFKEEHQQLELFTKYSRSSCLLECLIKRVKRKCKCLPWDLPRHKNETILPCILNKLHCPRIVLQRFSDKGCGCPLDCNEFKYTFSVQREHWDRDKFCKEEIELENSTFVAQAKMNTAMYMVKNPYGTRSTMKYVTDAPLRRCLSASKSGLEFEVSYDGSSGQRFVKRKRVTFPGMLSNIGINF